jgi:hypothetical protein
MTIILETRFKMKANQKANSNNKIARIRSESLITRYLK